MLTIDKARKILGKDADALSDKDLMREIEQASFLADLTLEIYKRKRPLLQKFDKIKLI